MYRNCLTALVYTTKAPSTVRPQASPSVGRSSYSPPTSANSTPLSPIPPSPASYVPPSTQTDSLQRPASQYSPAFSYDPPRNSLPASYSNQTPGVQRSIGQALGDNGVDEDSQMMNETLGVIDEHITTLSTPRQSLAPPQVIRDDSDSEYSRDLDQQSYIAGPETDDEESGKLTEAEVRRWDHKKVAQHLRMIGVDPRHCDIFEDQEISGEVLLEMDQNFISMKEYDFGTMGRRLKTWHKVRDFQNLAKGGGVKSSRQSTLASNDGASSIVSSVDDAARPQSRLISSSALLPRIPSLSDSQSAMQYRQSQMPGMSRDDSVVSPQLQTSIGRSSLPTQTPPSPWRASMVSDTSSRPSAAMVRELTHSRRHSSIDFGKPPDLELSSSHQKQASLDRDWSMGSVTGMTASPTMTSTSKVPAISEAATSPPVVTNLDSELDRGYFSGNEVDNRKQRSILRKKDNTSASAMHSRQSSANNAAMKRHSRLSSVDSIRGFGSQAISDASKAYHGMTYKGRFRSSSAKNSLTKSPVSPPAVTNLEGSNAAATPRAASTGLTPKPSMQNKARRLIGLRSSSETPNNAEKSPSQAAPTPDSIQPSPVASPTGSTTPSGTSRSLELEKPSEAPSKLNDMPGMVLPKPQARNKPKAKQETSAYQRGLLKLTPAEARKHCDYHGWMKKKSSSLITTWKPRLFILRGRRLSYYYSEDDTQERGIIDIGSHKVLVANSDAMVTLHATLTGATSTASPNTNSASAEASPTLPKSPEAGSGSYFYFKLVPPKSGASRAVQFTKPTIHYFQCDSLDQGRKWMGEIMKATIEHDLSTYETTNKQKTISLAKARARRERPPALQESADATEAETPQEEKKDSIEEGGLNIQGLNLQESPVSIESSSKLGKAEVDEPKSTDTNVVGGTSAPTTA